MCALVLHLIVSPFNCCLSVVLYLDKGDYAKIRVLCFVLIMFLLTLYVFRSPLILQCGIANVLIKVLSTENPDLTYVLLLEPGVR